MKIRKSENICLFILSHILLISSSTTSFALRWSVFGLETNHTTADSESKYITRSHVRFVRPYALFKCFCYLAVWLMWVAAGIFCRHGRILTLSLSLLRSHSLKISLFMFSSLLLWFWLCSMFDSCRSVHASHTLARARMYRENVVFDFRKIVDYNSMRAYADWSQHF